MKQIKEEMPFWRVPDFCKVRQTIRYYARNYSGL